MSAGAVRAGGVFVEIGADPRKFFAALGKVNGQIGKLGGSMARAGAQISAVGGAIVGPIFASAAAFASVGSALNDMSKRTGVAAESLSVLQFAADQTGTDMAGVETAVKKMQKAIFAAANGSDEAAKSLAMVGLSAKDLAGMSADEQMGKIADGLMAIEDPGTRAAVAMQIFGKSGTAILPMLEGGSRGMAAFAAEAKRLGLVMDTQTAEKADALGDAMDAMSASMKMAFIQVGSAVAPILTKMANGLAIAASSAGKFISENQDIVTSVLALGSALAAAGTGIFALGSTIQVASFALAGFGKAASIVMSPMTMLIGAASSVGKSFTLAMPATAKLASSISASMLSASASVLSFASVTASAMSGVAAASASGIAGFAASGVAGFSKVSDAALTAAKAMFPVFFTGFNRGISAGAGFFSATLRGLSGVVKASSVLRGAMSAASGSVVGRFVGDITKGLTLTYKSFVWWASGASARLAQYAANLTGAVGKTIASTAAMSAAWVGSAARGVASFVGSALAGIGSYIAGTVAAAAASVASAAAVAAAWMAPIAPFALLAAAAVGVGAAIKQFGPEISGAFSGLAGYVSEAGGALAGGFSRAVSDGVVVLGDLAKTATTTFNGVYEAVAAGDLSGAMDVLWAGLIAGWLRGTEAMMSYVDPWVAAFQDVFTDIGSGIYMAWDKIYTDSAALLNTMSAFILGLFDNVANGVMATFDNLVGAIQVAWTRVQGFITGAKDTEERVKAIKDENAARAEQRMQERPGIQSRTSKAAEQNAQAEKERQGRVAAVEDNAANIKAARQDENRRRADERRVATQGAEATLSQTTMGQSDTRARNSQAESLLAEIRGATSTSQLAGEGGLGDQFQTLRDLGRLTSEQERAISDALDKAAEGLTTTATNAADQAASDARQSKAEIAGTFSSSNLGGMGFGSSLAERTAKAAEDTAKGVNTLVEQGGGKVAA
jgi:hypothetical protein